MVNTGIYASEEEVIELRAMAERVAKIPVIAGTSQQALRGEDLASQAWQQTRKRCHELALAHGLPEIKGFYGMDHDGQFVRTDD